MSDLFENIKFEFNELKTNIKEYGNEDINKYIDITLNKILILFYKRNEDLYKSLFENMEELMIE